MAGEMTEVSLRVFNSFDCPFLGTEVIKPLREMSQAIISYNSS
jgi:hypothetical protein